MKKFFMSDLHIGHKNLACAGPNKSWENAHRGFLSVEDHDKTILDSINNVVTSDDELYLLGDLTLNRREKDILHIIHQIPTSKIYVCLGNHDKLLRKKVEDIWKHKSFSDPLLNHFKLISADMTITVGSQRLYLHHCPVASFPGMHRGAWHLHGHVHNKDFQRPGKVLNLAMESIFDKTGKWEPVEFEFIKNFMDNRNFVKEQSDLS